ncbi:TetR family transcriptional regulator [Gracilibacillus salitolerans]|uniref:TetR family transcriptional regulator n=1 Tax=Gracilibacillus salitolerans TaxID=2663022 RepID=A0A5Q2TH40_9BACI|nr:TetR/AcrR family transcriptional regulator [Gracilibacillus salitolerans]QGH33362.1 TetR family transcriptional regulator [Gracilibacillus salitolerans]
MDGFKKRTQRKKNKILEATLHLFSTYGIKNVPITKIASEANVSQVTIYNYFESKDNLIHETMVYFVEKEYQKFQDIIDSDIRFPEKIEQIIFNKTDDAAKINEELYHYLMSDFSSEGSYIDKVYQEKALPLFNQLIDEGKRTGFIHQDISTEAIMIYIHMFKDYMKKENVSDYILPLTEDILKLFFYGIMGKID